MARIYSVFVLGLSYLHEHKYCSSISYLEIIKLFNFFSKFLSFFEISKFNVITREGKIQKLMEPQEFFALG
jgi:hypothetical protein